MLVKKIFEVCFPGCCITYTYDSDANDHEVCMLSIPGNFIHPYYKALNPAT